MNEEVINSSFIVYNTVLDENRQHLGRGATENEWCSFVGLLKTEVVT